MSQAPAIHTFTDAQELTRAAAGLFLEVGKQAIAERNRFLVALSGGSTPKALYSILANDKYAQQLNWSKVHFLFGDERSVPPTHADSNFAMANAILFSPLHIPSAQIHRMRGEDPPETAAAQYETTLRHLTTAVPGQWPRLDLVLLGMGDDGHTASLFPGTASLTEQTRWVVPSTSPQGTRARVTLTLGVINHASVILFLVAGRNKAAVVRRVLEQRPGDPGPYPAALIRPETGRLLWYLDRAAASELTATTDD
ncbi:MAG: 6-phosphogluconolactonase [Nitrospira sp.]|uniref:6-phosphogluconolactonase n=1 Tax=Nitrospira sp. ND1 TaxID=1658518 RepID=UPI0009BC02F3|nr:6-phosphogluconolactonase [Nitrospira sp. ND1]MBK8376454.1 6-phosphogluconolactonase [Nitrospira sp.]MBK9110359.1 6-phosphogluconolactonase [Nitrospira sp.]MBP7360224.1 6-phosphogluconolactonase [Nitrospira sp.]MBP8103863.1 6-phosphogluconolactonase [Nitrospira sp.]MBP8200168.1 6-phosphogluconolactonase [Nitrospira sp.]